MQEMPLNDLDWTLTLDAGEAPQVIEGIPATVPGCVHLDLMAADVIPDPYLGDNEAHMQWVGRCGWRYRATFDAPGDLLRRGRVELAFRELDTAATVVLNGTEVGAACNQHHPHAFDVKDHLREGTNDLEVVFESPLVVAEREIERLGDLPRAGNGSNPSQPHNFIRKMACNMGWDWGPMLATCGISGPVTLRGFDAARIEHVRPLTTDIKDGVAHLDVLIDLDRQRGGALDVRATLTKPNGDRQERQTVTATGGRIGAAFKVSDPELWWPAGHGGQPLYGLEVELLDNGEVIDDFDCRVGLRTVRLDQREDEDMNGSRFAWWINGRPIVAKGANWIPDDCFPVRVTERDLRDRLTSAVECNLNMLRVWGGGLYASHQMLDLCDELGLMVAQDFLFACAAYSEEEPFRARVMAEARFNVADLARHPSLVHWNGCNENLWGYQEWPVQGRPDKKWPDVIGDRGWGDGYYFDLLPRVILELDPTRTYTPGSPFGKVREERANGPDRGTIHCWPGDYGGGEYRRLDARFVNEFGQQAPPAWSTFRDALGAEHLDVNDPLLDHRQRAHGHNERRIHNLIRERYGVEHDAADFDDWHHAAQLHQARAVTDGVRWWRSRFPHCMGTVYWQWNDCWPVTSWAALDSNGRRKLLWHATKKAYAPRLVTVQPADPGDYQPGDPLRAVCLNDTDQEWRAELIVRRLTVDGRELVRVNVDVQVPPFGAVPVPLSTAKLQQPGDPAGELITATIDGAERDTWLFLPERDVALPAPAFDVTHDARRVTVTAGTLLVDLCLHPDRVADNLAVDDNLVTLLPGEAHTFTLDGDVPEGTAWTKPVLRCVND